MQESVKIKCLFFTPEDFDSLIGEANHHIPSMAAALANQKILKLDNGFEMTSREPLEFNKK